MVLTLKIVFHKVLQKLTSNLAVCDFVMVIIIIIVIRGFKSLSIIIGKIDQT